MLLDKSKYKLDELTEEEKVKITALLDLISKHTKNTNDHITGIMFSRQFTEWSKLDNDNLIFISLRNDCKVDKYLSSNFKRVLDLLPDYDNNNLEYYIKDYDGVIIYG